jgi:L-2,4-diaminobutyrate decarboxylase
MNPDIQRVLDEIERDTSIEAATAFASLAARYFAATAAGDGRVSTPEPPASIAARFDEPLPPKGQPLEDVVARLERDVLADSNRLTHPRSMGHQVSAPLAAAVWTEAITAALNQSGAVWEMSPVGTIIETRVIAWMCELARLPGGAGGTFTSGGTEATFAGLLAARQAALPDAWSRGVGANPPVVVCGEHAHYGVARAIGELGLGTANLVAVPSRDWRMDAEALVATLDRLAGEGRRVMAVVATAGSTATGSFDDLDAIGRACESRRLWLHVDGAHGASALLSDRHRHRLAGIERASSVAWDPHKMMLMPLTASAVLVRRESDLEAAFSQSAPYLFHAREGRNWDQGLRSFTCSRRIDALKVWVALQRHGARAFGLLYDHLCETARSLYDLVRARPDFEAIHEPESNILCFRYVGAASAPSDVEAGSSRLDTASDAPGASDVEAGFSRLDTAKDLDALNLRLREEYNRSGDGWLTTTMLGGRRVLRTTFMNPRTKTADLQRVLDGLAELGRRLDRQDG